MGPPMRKLMALLIVLAACGGLAVLVVREARDSSTAKKVNDIWARDYVDQR